MWCTTRFWLGWSALYTGDPAGALDHFTAVRDTVTARTPLPALADCLAGRAVALTSQGRAAEASEDGQRAQALARKLSYPAGEGLPSWPSALSPATPTTWRWQYSWPGRPSR